MRTVTFDFKDGDKLELKDIHANDKPEEAVIKFNSFEIIEIETTTKPPGNVVIVFN